MNQHIRLIALILGSLLVSCTSNRAPFTYADPIEKGFSTEKLDTLGNFLASAGSSALMILVDGQIVYEWGDPYKKTLVHSIRKPLLNSLYGIYISNGTIDTTLTLGELAIDDIPPGLSDQEKTATIADLLKSRSGVYHDAAAVSEGMLRGKPPRDSHAPGTNYYYNNWDFNVLGHILEQLTGECLYKLFYQHIALPLGMQYEGQYVSIVDPDENWEIPNADGFYQLESNQSKYPAYHFRLSAMDLALYAQLYLQKGEWKGKQIIPEPWIEASTQPYSIINPDYGIGYGMLWRVLIPNENRTTKSFFHTGTGIHMMGIYPGSNLVLIHRVDTEKAYDFNEGDFYQMIDKVWSSKIN